MAYVNQNSLNKLKVASFLLNFAELDRMIELNRQTLTCFRGFEPYCAFQRLVQGSSNSMAITPGSLDQFTRDVSMAVDFSSLETIVNMYSSKLAGFLDFEDFLRLVLAREASDARFEAARREVPNDVVVCIEIEYMLGRLILKLADFFRKLKVDPETQTLLADTSTLFSMLGGRTIDYASLQTFFKTTGLVVSDKDILAILRLIDINDDGVIDRAEFDYFISLINVRHNGGTSRDLLAQKVRGKTKSVVVEAESPISRPRYARETREVREVREEVKSPTSSIQSRMERPRRSNFVQDPKPDEKKPEREQGYQKIERTYYREEKKEVSPPRSLSKSVGTIARERKIKREEVKKEEVRTYTQPDIPAEISRSYANFTPKTRQSDKPSEDLFVSGFHALKPYGQTDELRLDNRRPSAVTDRKNETYSFKRTVIEEKERDSPKTHARTPTKSSKPEEEKQPIYTREHIRRVERDLSNSKGNATRIQESIRTQEVVRPSRDTASASEYQPRHREGQIPHSRKAD